MLIKDIRRCRYIEARDDTFLCELLHPAREEVRIPYSIAHAILRPGRASRSHRLKESTEVLYFLEGEGRVHINDESAAIRQGQAVLVPHGSWQHIQNTGTTDLKILCIVFPSWSEDDEELDVGGVGV
jgi:mannose-6-phosphate isomerase-like protein (cupin superfamily)